MQVVVINYDKIGLKVGLEIHQQLSSEKKLFCNCKTELFKGEPETTFLRRLRPTQSELGQIDPAAFFEFQKGTQVLYEIERETSCLVEMDEEPPVEATIRIQRWQPRSNKAEERLQHWNISDSRDED